MVVYYNIGTISVWALGMKLIFFLIKLKKSSHWVLRTTPLIISGGGRPLEYATEECVVTTIFFFKYYIGLRVKVFLYLYFILRVMTAETFMSCAASD
jgi:hypothetical protein